MWWYVDSVMIGRQRAEAAQYDIPRGNLSDLYPRWLGARELLLHHRDPYSRDVTREIQAGYYGRPLDPARPHDPVDQQGFAYPVYVVFLLAPTIPFPFAVVQAGFRWFLVALTIASILLWLRTLRWRAPAVTIAIVGVLVFGSFPVIQGLKLQQLSLLVSGLIAACAVLIDEEHLAAAGVLLAMATIKPQLALPMAAWLLLWALSGWRQRRGLALGFGVSMAALFAASEYVLPGWIARFSAAVAAYRQYTGGAGSVLDELLTPRAGEFLSALVLLAVAIVGWQNRRAPAESPAFNWTTVFVLAATVVIAPKTAPYNQVLLLPALMLAAQHWRRLWTRGPLARAGTLVSASLVVWPWLAVVALAGASFFLPEKAVQKAWTLPLYTTLAIPGAVIMLLALIRKDPTEDAL